MVASVPFDTQVHDTYFVVAHFHYVLIGGAVFPLLGGIYYWFPKMTGRLMSERVGKVVFGMIFAGTHLTFFPMHLLGLMGMPRRVYTYQPEMPWSGLNMFVSASAFLLALGFLAFFIDVVRSALVGERCGPNPWGASTLEWATTSPPPDYNFAHIPFVENSEPLWGREFPVAIGLRNDRREVIVSSVVEARPQARESSVGPSIWPLLSAIATSVMLIWSIFTPWAVVWGTLPVTVCLIGWFWPKGAPEEEA
jgi:heme/copper-type cytochrome/quinol oxidase subunit 1